MKYFLMALLLVGCASTTQQKIDTAATDAAYLAELAACADAAIGGFQDGGSPINENAQYIACANAVDIKYGRKPQ